MGSRCVVLYVYSLEHVHATICRHFGEALTDHMEANNETVCMTPPARSPARPPAHAHGCTRTHTTHLPARLPPARPAARPAAPTHAPTHRHTCLERWCRLG